MPIPRVRNGLQNLHQFLRLICAWWVCWGFGIAIFVLLPFRSPTDIWKKLRLPWARTVLWLLRIRLNVRGAEHLRGPGVFIANHMSFIDVVILPALVPRECRVVAKREVLYFPIVGWGFAVGGALLVDRRNPRLASVRLLQAAAKLPRGWSLVIFPEGTRSRTGALQRFKRGAFSLAIATKLPVVPIALANTQHIMGPGAWFVRPGTVDVQVGAPISTHTWREETIRDHMQQGREAVAQCLSTLDARAQGHEVAASESVR